MNILSLLSGVRGYIDARLDEAKLMTAKSVSSIISQIAAYLIISILAIITVCFLAFAEMQWLNECLGQPFGTLISAGTLVLIIFVVFLLRKHLFTGTLCKGISRALGVGKDTFGNR